MRLCTLFVTLVLGLVPVCGWPASMEIEIASKVSGEAVQPGSLRYRNSAGEVYSITRISYLLSGFALKKGDGSWEELTNQVAWLEMESGRFSFRLSDVPAGLFEGVRFYIGPDENQNHADVAKYPADHPFNPNLNGLHWSWQGGYIFMALEGLWRNSDGVLEGWAYHLARDTNRVLVTLSTPHRMMQNSRLKIDLNLGALLDMPRPISFANDGSSTHSRDGDPIARALVANLPGAFQVGQLSDLASNPVLEEESFKPPFLPAQFRPYKLEISSRFPIPDLPRDNPLIEERVALGKLLFNEKQMSRDGSISCASCHSAELAFSDVRRFSIGVSNRVGVRNAMPLFNLAWKTSFFWDGRAPSLRSQSVMPIQDHAEMDENLTNVVAKLTRAGYETSFAKAFDPPQITAEKIGLALEQFLLTLISNDSRFDRALRGEEQLTKNEQRGLELFFTEFDPRRSQYGADCFHCHGGAQFRSQAFANNGLDRVFADPGRANVTGRDTDRGKFATPSLRNVALTGPYMHDGRFATLEEVIEHYSKGAQRSGTLDPNIAKHPDGGLGLSEDDKAALIAFLKTLTDPRWGDAAAAR